MYAKTKRSATVHWKHLFNVHFFVTLTCDVYLF